MHKCGLMLHIIAAEDEHVWKYAQHVYVFNVDDR